MTVASLPDLDLPKLGDVEDRERPVLSYTWEAAEQHRAAAHRHSRAHIIDVASGAYWVETPEGTWLVPQGLAVWIPPFVPHEIYSHGAVKARVLFVDSAHAGSLPPRCGTVRPTAFMQAALSRIIGNGNDYLPDSPAARLAVVMLDELALMEFAKVPLPISREPRLARVMSLLVANPLAEIDTDKLAQVAGASPRTLFRLFKAETGLSIGEWRTNLLLEEAIRRLARGSSVTAVAFDLGYSSASAFTYMFRRRLGVPPRDYR